MVRLLYTRQDGHKFETDSFEDWKVDGYMSAMKARVISEEKWVMPNGTQIALLPDSAPLKSPYPVYQDSYTQHFFNPDLQYRRHPSVLGRLWWKLTQRLR